MSTARGGAAALAIAFAIFFNDLVGGTLSPEQARLLTIGALGAVTLVNLAPVGANGVVAMGITALKVLLVVGIGLAAFAFGDGAWGHFAANGAAGTCEGVPEGARLGVAGFDAAVVGALWSYGGWANVSFVAEEVHAPGRTLPRALVGASVLIIALYLFVNAGYFYVLDPGTVASVPETLSVAGPCSPGSWGQVGPR